MPKEWRSKKGSVSLVSALLDDYSNFTGETLIREAAKTAMEEYIKADIKDFPGQQENMGEWSLPLCYWVDGFRAGLRAAIRKESNVAKR